MLKQKLSGLFLCLLLVSVPVRGALPTDVNGKPMPSLAPMVEKVTPAVVNIATRSNANVAQNPLMNDPFFRRFFNIPDQRPQQNRPQSLGSGVVIDAKKGYVITNHHVIGRADEITVTLRDGRELSAKLIGSDPDADIAVLQVPAEGLSDIPLSDSDDLRVGDFVVAVGNPFGLGQTVTSGIVSALGRSGLGIEGYEDFIQTDASINPGNSGGALVNLNGELVGMNTAILAPGGGNIGIGFAIPTNMVRSIMDQLLQHGEVRRGMLGVATQDLTPELAQAFDIKSNQGAVIARVFPDTPASRAGLKDGDVVTQINDRNIKNSSDMRNTVGLARVGEMLNITVLRNGKQLKLKAKLEEPKQRNLAGDKISPHLAGATIGQVQSDEEENLNLVITNVEQGSPAWYARLQKGDVILSVNRQRVHTLDELKKAAGKNGQILLNIQRGNAALFVLLK